MKLFATPLRATTWPRVVSAALGLAALSTLSVSAAVTWHDVQFGGFASQGFLANTGVNDYLGATSNGTFDFREYAANASWSTGKFRVGAQAFGQKLGAYGDDKIKLDWAIADYQVAQWFGIRAGRVKMPRGLYNEALDLDSIRPFVLLPQSVYDARLRDFNAFNGAMIYGNVDFKRAGSLDYRAFYGKMPLTTKSGASDYFNTDAPFPNKSISIDSVIGGSFFWSTPIPGLRAGYSVSQFKNFFTGRYVPRVLADRNKIAPYYDRHLVSVEYSTGDWVLAAEAGKEDDNFVLALPTGVPYGSLAQTSRYYYISVSRRINSRLEVGSYYSHSHWAQTAIGTPTVSPDLDQGDFAVSARYDLTEHLLFKVELHHMDGAGKVFDLPTYPQPVAKRDNSWNMVAIKTTYSF